MISEYLFAVCTRCGKMAELFYGLPRYGKTRNDRRINAEKKSEDYRTNLKKKNIKWGCDIPAMDTVIAMIYTPL